MVGQDLLVTGIVQIQLETQCARCLENIQPVIRTNDLYLLYEKCPDQEKDITEDIRQVEANAALLGATRRDWFPQLLVSGSIGFASGEMKSLFRSRSLTWEIAPTIKWNIFSGNDRVNATREARAALDGSILDFNEKMLTAMQEVESAMSEYENSITQIVALREAVNQNEETLILSLELYKQGLTQFQNVLDAQRSLLTYQNYLVQAQGNSLIYLVQLYEALGGGW